MRKGLHVASRLTCRYRENVSDIIVLLVVVCRGDIRTADVEDMFESVCDKCVKRFFVSIGRENVRKE